MDIEEIIKENKLLKEMNEKLLKELEETKEKLKEQMKTNFIKRMLEKDPNVVIIVDKNGNINAIFSSNGNPEIPKELEGNQIFRNKLNDQNITGPNINKLQSKNQKPQSNSSEQSDEKNTIKTFSFQRDANEEIGITEQNQEKKALDIQNIQSQNNVIRIPQNNTKIQQKTEKVKNNDKPNLQI